MFVLATHLSSLPVISLQTGENVATVAGLILNPDKLKLMALKLNVGRSPRTLLVMTSVRQLAPDCVIIDDEDDLSEPDDIVRLTEFVKKDYSPIGKRVQSESGQSLGTVDDYTINLETEQVQKIYVHPPTIHAWYKSSLIIDRSQIIDVQPTRFIVRDTHQYTGALAPKTSGVEPS